MFRRFHSSRSIPSTLVAVVVALALAACGDVATSPPTPGGAPPTDPSPTTPWPTDPSSSAVKFWEAGSSVYWNRVARELLPTHPQAANPVVQARALTYLSIAQYNAVVAAEAAKERGEHASAAAADGQDRAQQPVERAQQARCRGPWRRDRPGTGRGDRHPRLIAGRRRHRR